jgi:uncharacterized protein YecA (UPF0149 family)
VSRTAGFDFDDEEMPPLLPMPGVLSPAPVTHKKIGRNEPCPCGSGKKYKKCCGV